MIGEERVAGPTSGGLKGRQKLRRALRCSLMNGNLFYLSLSLFGITSVLGLVSEYLTGVCRI